MLKPLHTVQVEIPVIFYKEGDFIVAYTPTLDLAAQGMDEKEAEKNFSEVINIFFDETTKRGTLEEALLGLGWAKKQATFEPPKIVGTHNKKIEVPVFA